MAPAQICGGAEPNSCLKMPADQWFLLISFGASPRAYEWRCAAALSLSLPCSHAATTAMLRFLSIVIRHPLHLELRSTMARALWPVGTSAASLMHGMARELPLEATLRPYPAVPWAGACDGE